MTDSTLISKGKVWLVLILGSLSAFGPLSMDMYLPSLPTVATDLHTTTSTAQLSLTACLLGLAFGQLFFGPLSDKIGRRKPLLITLILYSTASLLCGLANSIELLIVMRFIQGFTGAAGIVISKAAARDLYSGKDLTKFIALLALVNGVAPIVAPLFGGIILSFAQWHFVFYTLAIIGLVMLVAVIWKLPETLPVAERVQGNILAPYKSFPKILKDKSFMNFAISQALIMTCLFAYIAGSPFVLQKMYGLTAVEFSATFAINGVGIIIATQITARLASTIAEQSLLRFGTLLATIGSTLLLIVAVNRLSIWLLMLSLLLIVAAVGIVTTTAFSLAMQNQGKQAGSASALLGLLAFVGGSIVSPLVGIAGEDTAIPMALVIFVCALVAYILNLFLKNNTLPVNK
ncbi:multidrug effflux MFS transporter [Kurthia sibirica]|uniref:Bcr/CflA family efflux transporter n=1 Tax=Kurthia sibirica TaxID=202750 RepID=A0A2U3AN93_9BACL|nr:multidrug effflux MFS transporter [Kurthia sibirica]PWI26013.1 MFS transporter [Kurthia sibirica]GEK35266.1 Bcr/CflA family drug resistance efflux transporter [Kurthia sibirica]